MATLKLFLGFPITDIIPSNQTTQDELYLQYLEMDQEKYIGKFVHPFPTITALDELAINILSLMKKTFPDFSDHRSLTLIAVHDAT